MQYLKSVRKARGLTLKELGRKCDISESALSQIENGKKNASFETMLKLAEELDTSIDYLLTGFDPTVHKYDSWLLDAYNNAPAEVRRIVDAALEPYRHPQKDQRAI